MTSNWQGVLGDSSMIYCIVPQPPPSHTGDPAERISSRSHPREDQHRLRDVRPCTTSVPCLIPKSHSATTTTQPTTTIAVPHSSLFRSSTIPTLILLSPGPAHQSGIAGGCQTLLKWRTPEGERQTPPPPSSLPKFVLGCQIPRTLVVVTVPVSRLF